MKGKLFKTGDQYLLRSESKEVLAISNGSTEGRKLSLKNCQAIERGYDLDELVEKSKQYTDDMTNIEECFVGHHRDGFRKGFQKALEILGDKKFTKEQLIDAADWYVVTKGKKSIDDFIQSLQQNEWEVEVEMGICGDKVYAVPEPELDADGCLILRRVTN